MKKLRYFFDTEFIEEPGFLMPISIGIVCEDGREFYGINEAARAHFHRADAWVYENVIAKLPAMAVRGTTSQRPWMFPDEMAKGIMEFICARPFNTEPEFWAYFASYDWVCLFTLLGRKLIDHPKDWPMYCLDLRQTMHERGTTKDMLPPKPPGAHNALEDARWLRDACYVTLALPNTVEHREELVRRRSSGQRLTRAEHMVPPAERKKVIYACEHCGDNIFPDEGGGEGPLCLLCQKDPTGRGNDGLL